MVGSRWLMPPDALQPKAYCTNPGLYSFLLAPLGVSTRDPSSERRKYLGDKWPMNFAWKCPTSTYTFRDLLHTVNLRHGTNGFTSLPKEGVLRIFLPWKIRRLQSGLNPRTWVPKASTLPNLSNFRMSWYSTRISCRIFYLFIIYLTTFWLAHRFIFMDEGYNVL